MIHICTLIDFIKGSVQSLYTHMNIQNWFNGGASLYSWMHLHKTTRVDRIIISLLDVINFNIT